MAVNTLVGIVLALTISVSAHGQFAPAPAGPTFIPHEIAVLRALDKVTARVSRFEVPVDDQTSFGTLGIRIRSCQKTPPEEEPDAAAFLEIWERRPADTQSRWVFSGWMFAASPALSAMDHPVYDVWVIDCQKASSTSASEAE